MASEINEDFRQVIVKQANRLTSTNRFNPKLVKEYVDSYLKKRFSGMSYDMTWSRDLCLQLCEEIKSSLKRFRFDRYKLVVMTTIGANWSQELGIGSRCLWDEGKDSYTTSVFTSRDMFAVVVVYGVYLD